MAKAKKLDPDHFNRQPLSSMTAEQKVTYLGLRAHSDDDGILEVDEPFLSLRIWGSHRRSKDFLITLSALQKSEAVVRYRSDGRNYLILPHHFYLEGRIQYYSPSEYPRPPKEFYVKYPHYNRGLQAHMDKLNRSAQGSTLPPDPPLIKQRGSTPPLIKQRGSGSTRGGIPEKLRPVLERVFKKHNIPYDPITLKPLNVSHSEKTLNGGGSDEGKGSVKGVNEKKRESPKGEKGEEGAITLERILKVCGDEQSKNFYKLVLARCPQKMVRTAFIETECVIQEKKLRTTPGRYFTGLIKKLATKERITLDGLTALRR
jgi:hypothetical protein